MKIWILILLFDYGSPYQTIYLEPTPYTTFLECYSRSTKVWSEYDDTLDGVSCQLIKIGEVND